MAYFLLSPAFGEVFWLMAAMFFDQSCSFVIEMWISVPQGCTPTLVLIESKFKKVYSYCCKKAIMAELYGPWGFFVEHIEVDMCAGFQVNWSHVWGAWPFQNCFFEHKLQHHNLADWAHVSWEALAHHFQWLVSCFFWVRTLINTFSNK